MFVACCFHSTMTETTSCLPVPDTFRPCRTPTLVDWPSHHIMVTDLLTLRCSSLLEEQGQQLSEALTGPYGSTPASFRSFRSSPLVPVASPAISPRSLEGTDTSPETQFLIPPAHTATLAWLLSVPPICSVIGEFPRSYFNDLEHTTALPRPLDLIQPRQIDWPSLEPDHLRGLADAYFNAISAHLPLFSRQTYEELQNDFLENGPTQGVETAICLCVYALGYMASHSTKPAVPEHVVEPIEDLGLHFFAIALRIIISKTVWAFTPSLRTCQALILAATYFCYLGRPLHSCRMTQYAGQMLLDLINSCVILLPIPLLIKLTSLLRQVSHNRVTWSITRKTIFAYFGVASSRSGKSHPFSSPFGDTGPGLSKFISTLWF